MKISNSVKALYDSLFESYQKLEARAEDLFPNRVKQNRWHFTARVKSIESFALKLETGWIPNPSELDDFFAATIVVENSSMIPDAIGVVEELCTLQYRRPQTDSFTKFEPERFSFDDLRLYVRLKPEIAKISDLEKLTFEIQIKTFLQHAWGVATHDLVYKANTVSWPQARIAYQVKAMLEHAELSILQAEHLAKSPTVAKEDKVSKNLLRAIKFLEKNWTEAQLPRDKKRLAQTVEAFRTALSTDLNTVQVYLDAETEADRGVKTLSLSPYAILVQSIANQAPELLLSFFALDEPRFKLFIPREISLPDNLKDQVRNCIRL